MEEIKLEYREFTAWRQAEDLVLTHEESMETAIPEYCPDVARIVDAVGRLRFREHAVKDGQLTISGSVFVTVLYTSEERAGLRSLTLSLPFSCRADDQRSCQVTTVRGRVLLLEVKPLGTRKLYVRALAEFRAGGYLREGRTIAVQVGEAPDRQVRYGKDTLELLRDVWTLEIPFAQEAAPEGGDTEGDELLMDRCCLRVSGCQRFGSKLVVKGEASIFLLCRDRDQHLETRMLTLPFSQIVDHAELPDEGEVDCRAQVLEHEVHPIRGEGGSTYSVTMRIGLLFRVYERVSVAYVSDLYSTRYELSAQRQKQSFPTAQMPESLRRETAQRLEGTGPFVYLTDVECTPPEASAGDGEAAALHSTVHLRILYLDESGTPVIAERSAEVTGQVGRIPEAAAVTPEPESWQRISSGYEVRIPVVFTLDRSGEEEISSVSTVQQEGEIDRSAMPSLILRRLREGETLWDVARQCRTEEQAILAANGLAQGEDPGGRMLLIPKVR